MTHTHVLNVASVSLKKRIVRIIWLFIKRRTSGITNDNDWYNEWPLWLKIFFNQYKCYSVYILIFINIIVLKNFAIFTGKHLCWSLLLIDLRTWRPATFLKRNSNTEFSREYCKIFKSTYFDKNLRTTASAIPPSYS